MSISAVHESRHVQHTKKHYATFVQRLFLQIHKADLAGLRSYPFINLTGKFHLKTKHCQQ